MNALLKQISDHASRDLADLIESGSEDILKAIHKAESEAQLQETKPKFSLGYKITVEGSVKAEGGAKKIKTRICRKCQETI